MCARLPRQQDFFPQAVQAHPHAIIGACSDRRNVGKLDCETVTIQLKVCAVAVHPDLDNGQGDKGAVPVASIPHAGNVLDVLGVQEGINSFNHERSLSPDSRAVVRIRLRSTRPEKLDS